SDQYSTDPEGGTFFLRMEFRIEGLEQRRAALVEALAGGIARRFAMQWRFSYAGDRKRIAILVSRYDHCLLDVLWRWRRGELQNAEIVAVVSNHADLEPDVRGFGVPYHHVPVLPEDKSAAER